MVSAIYLAAGSSERMGTHNKLLLPVAGKPLFLIGLDHLLQSGVSEVIVVTGYEHDEVEATIGTRKVKVAYNPDFKTGLTSSIKAGINIIKPDNQGIMICLADLPGITTNEYNLLIETFKKLPDQEKKVIVPVYQNQRGNPVLFSRHFVPELLACKQPDGCKSVIESHSENVLEVIFPNDHILGDVDTPEQFNHLIGPDNATR